MVVKDVSRSKLEHLLQIFLEEADNAEKRCKGYMEESQRICAEAEKAWNEEAIKSSLEDPPRTPSPFVVPDRSRNMYSMAEFFAGTAHGLHQAVTSLQELLKE